MHGAKSSSQPAESSSVAMTPTYMDSPRKVKGAIPAGSCLMLSRTRCGRENEEPLESRDERAEDLGEFYPEPS